MEIQEIEVNSFLTKSKSFDHVFNPYRGCMHRCKYFYAHYMKDYTQHKEAWGDYVDVKKIKRYHIPKNAKRIMLSSVTDPYQPIEAKYKVTRNALKHLIGFSGTVSILTKSKLVTRDIDLFKQMEHVEVGMSIATVDEKFRRIMEEGASPIKERMEALKKIHDAGITTYVFVAPMLPKLTNYKEIIRESKPYVDYYMFDTLRLKGENKTWVMEEIKKHAPTLLPLYQQIYNQGKRHYFELLSKQIEEFCIQEKVEYQLFF